MKHKLSDLLTAIAHLGPVKQKLAEILSLGSPIAGIFFLMLALVHSVFDKIAIVSHGCERGMSDAFRVSRLRFFFIGSGLLTTTATTFFFSVPPS